MGKTQQTLILALAALAITACASSDADRPFTTQARGTFEEPWAMAFLPDGRLLVTEKPGRLLLVDPDAGISGSISGLPEVDYGGQGGLGDVALHPDFAGNGLVYVSYAEPGDGDTRGAAVARGKLELAGNGGNISDLQVIWRQNPKTTGKGHYGHRLRFSPDGYLFITSGDRQKFDPAQDMDGNLGKILRLRDDGSVPGDNPFADRGGVTAEIWTLGHRNPLGFDFDTDGRLWNTEMGPKGGDELNLVIPGTNYGYPIVSNGDHYDGRDIPDHDTRPEFEAPKLWWTPVISPGDFMFYTGSLFPEWQGDGFAAGLSSKALVRIGIDGDTAVEAERFDMGQRIRAVRQGPDGAIWLLEDGDDARLLELRPRG